ncbi:MAG TPA: cob(I)yrinic acid a,c-diamide adenosyltransferase [Acetobacteraceae bacterium]
MIRIDRVVTRGGDGGQTSLGDGARVAKDSPRIEAIGAVDEANAVIGLLRAVAADAAGLLGGIQNDLFDVGADLCVPDNGRDRLRLTDAPTKRLEAEIARMNATIPPLTSFVLPGGTEAAARAHHARTVVRRAERCVVHLAGIEPINPAVVRYLNRLSDLLFVLGRVLNDNGAGDVQWVPGASLSDRKDDLEQDKAAQQP